MNTINSRGFSVVALHNCKNPYNVGGVLRAAGCYGTNMIVMGGKRVQQAIGGLATDTQKAYRHIPLLRTEDVLDFLPYHTVPVAVDLVPDAVELADFVHPERAFYVFGPEDGTLGKTITERCKYKVMIPTRYCMNLAATVNVVLYDRQAKQKKVIKEGEND